MCVCVSLCVFTHRYSLVIFLLRLYKVMGFEHVGHCFPIFFPCGWLSSRQDRDRIAWELVGQGTAVSKYVKIWNLPIVLTEGRMRNHPETENTVQVPACIQIYHRKICAHVPFGTSRTQELALGKAACFSRQHHLPNHFSKPHGLDHISHGLDRFFPWFGSFCC